MRNSKRGRVISLTRTSLNNKAAVTKNFVTYDMPRSHTPGMTRAHRMNCWTVRFPRAFSGEKTSLPGLLAMKTLLCALCSYTTPRASFLRLRAVFLHVPGYDRDPAIVALGRRGRRGKRGHDPSGHDLHPPTIEKGREAAGKIYERRAAPGGPANP